MKDFNEFRETNEFDQEQKNKNVKPEFVQKQIKEMQDLLSKIDVNVFQGEMLDFLSKKLNMLKSDIELFALDWKELDEREMAELENLPEDDYLEK